MNVLKDELSYNVLGLLLDEWSEVLLTGTVHEDILFSKRRKNS